jgi:glycosyltransferase involved in cell wall biosynthesis
MWVYILFLVPRIDKASTKYRVLQYLDYLESEGIDCSIKELSKKSRNRFTLIKFIKKADIVFIQKKIFSKIEVCLIRFFAKKIVFDIDDAVMFKDGPLGTSAQKRQSRRFSFMAKNADLVICGNEYLKKNTEKLNANIRLLPTPVDMDRYVEKHNSGFEKKGITLGWIGSKVTLKYLKQISPALEQLSKRFPDLKLKIVADEFFEIHGLEVEKKEWSSTEEIKDLHSFDIGLMPLSDDAWTRGKCGFKLLQCMAVGLPVVCAPVGMNREIVTDGVEGFWARSQEEWAEKIGTLVQDGNLRETMGSKGRKKVEEIYSLSINAELMSSILREVCRS